MTDLQTYQKALEDFGYSCEFLSHSNDQPTDLVVIAIDPDQEGRERRITLRTSEADLTPMIKEEDQDLRTGKLMHHETFLHYYYLFPFTYEDKVLGDLARLLLFLNKGMDFTGFGLSEADKRVYFQYTLHAPGGQVTTQMAVGVIGLFELMLDSLADKVEAVCTGQKTLNEVVSEALAAAQEGPPPSP